MDGQMDKGTERWIEGWMKGTDDSLISKTLKKTREREN